MEKQEITKETLQKFIKAYPHNLFLKLNKKENAELRKWIDEQTKEFLSDPFYSYATKIFWILNDIKSFNDDRCKCPSCHRILTDKNIPDINRGFFRACSKECAAKNPARQEKIKKTTFEHYGSYNYFSSEEGKEKRRKYCEEHGVSNPFQIEAIKEKSKKTRKERFGYEYTMQSPEKRKLASDNYKKKTGYTHQSKNPEVIDKIFGTYFKHKAEGVLKKEEKFFKTIRKNRYEDLLSNKYVVPIFSYEEFISEKEQYGRIFKWKCLECGKEFEAPIDENFKVRFKRSARCPDCHPCINEGTSDNEKEIANFIELYSNIKQNDRTAIYPFEIDILVPSKKLAIEYNGLYWHTEENGKDKNYHLHKTKECEKQGIQLIHIFEDEWLYKQDIVKSRLKNLLGVYDNKCYARQCEVKEVSSSEAFDFQNANHIQGAVNSKVNLGLYYKDKLVSLMTFSKPRFDKKHEWELVRFCNKCGWHIPGAASKLLTHFEREYKPKNIVSYADRCWSKGNLYKRLGFELDHISPPDYFYFKRKDGFHRESRVKYQKHKLPKLLQNFDNALTESENMFNNQYFRIWNCGNLVFEKCYN